MAIRRAWVLNLDADLELGAPLGYQPSHRVRAIMKPHIERLATSLLGTTDVLVDETSPPHSARGLPGRAFCPTPRAIALLTRAGAEPEPHPSIDVLRRVNSRAFASSLGATLPGAAFVTELAAARATLGTDPLISAAWRVKYAFGMTGRNQRVILPSKCEGDDLAFVARGLEQGGLQIEPDVAIDEEYAMHALLSPDGSVVVGVLVRQRCDARGAWIATERFELTGAAYRTLAARMNDETHHVAGALQAAGYFGPFGIDAFTYQGRDGERGFQVRSEINARYSMGFAVGFG